jgi:hypothetical protein
VKPFSTIYASFQLLKTELLKTETNCILKYSDSIQLNNTTKKNNTAFLAFTLPEAYGTLRRLPPCGKKFIDIWVNAESEAAENLF